MLSTLASVVEYEQNRDVGSRIRKLESSISSLETDLEKIQKRKSELKELTEKATNEINNWKKEMGECKQKSEEYEKEILDWKKQASQATTSITKLNRQINSKETQIEQLISQKQEIAEQCELERITLPVLLDAAEEEDDSDGPQYDFSELDRAHLQERRPHARDKMDAEFRQKIESKSSEIERTAPNLRALDQYEAIQEKEKQVSQEFEAARKEEKQVADAYNTVKQKRVEYEQNRDVGSRIRKLESSISSLETDLEKIQKRKSELKELTEKATNEINNWKKEMGECKQKSEEYEKEILDWKKQASQATTSITKLNRQINSKEAQIEQLISQKQEIAEQCELERIALPVLSDAAEEEDDSDGPQYDFSELDRAHLQERRPSARDKMDAEFRQKIESKSSEIERTAPNLRALDQYEAIQEKEKQVSQEFEAARKEEKQVADAYNTVKQKSYRPSPFFILDEVDAALDNLNVAKVAQFIRSKSCQAARDNQDAEDGHGFQSIVISLKDSFYDKAEALVGVYRDVDKSCSSTMSFDLRNYAES
ncbi:hypothetical protein DY000_02056185 [Brassica cretica]|uniref:RecF/RecN/SMC N-terminal domain-containing protein n=1 Tax=Brassica cretica TaxID=69181 RepID=A0ABQ7A9P7_BRACR|nr:hypothetical protein DY000_02056185 [Brassica cretica]